MTAFPHCDVDKGAKGKVPPHSLQCTLSVVQGQRMDVRYQIFVSSTFTDLKDERQAVMQALLSLDHFPAGMELFAASDDDQWTLIKGVIDDSDYYVLVIGGRYGTTSTTGLSYTEMEFDYAVASKKPILAFIHENPNQIPAGKTDQNDKLREQLGAFPGDYSRPS